MLQGNHPQDSTIINLLIANFVTLAMGLAGMYFKHKADVERERLASQERQQEAERKARLTEHRHEEITQKLDVNTQLTQAAAVEASHAKEAITEIKRDSTLSLLRDANSDLGKAIVATTIDTNVQAHAIKAKVDEIAHDQERKDDAPVE